MQIEKLLEQQMQELYQLNSTEYGAIHDNEAYRNWHKQSLKQFIDGLIGRENEIVSTMEDYYPEFKFRMGIISGKNETISHLKKLKEQLN